MRRSPIERLIAWVLTGPVGHFVAGFVDWTAMLVRLRAQRKRAPGAR
jgi:hypothetical protein